MPNLYKSLCGNDAHEKPSKAPKKKVAPKTAFAKSVRETRGLKEGKYPLLLLYFFAYNIFCGVGSS